MMHFFGEFVGQAELVNDRQRIDARLASRAEYLRQHSFAAAGVAGEADHLEDHFVSGPGSFGAGVADVDRFVEGRAVHLHEPLIVLLKISADEGARGALQNLDDAAAALAGAAAFAVQLYEHLVARLRVAEIVRSDIDVVSPRVGARCESGAGSGLMRDQKAGAGSGLLDRSLQEIGGRAGSQQSIWRLPHLPPGDELFQDSAEFVHPLLGDVQLLGENVGRRRFVLRLKECFQDLLLKLWHRHTVHEARRCEQDAE
jgi:hypothetical protein